MLKIRELRIENGFTQRELAEKIKTNSKNIWVWEKGVAEPPIDILIQLADIFNVTVDYLIGNSDDFVSSIDRKPRTAAPMGETLTKEESDLLTFFRGMDNVCKEAIMTTAQNFYNLNKNSSAMVR